MRSQRILITGATGQVGSHLLWTLWRGGHDVTAMVRPGVAALWSEHLAAVEQTFGPIPIGCPVPRPLEGDLWEALAGIDPGWLRDERGRVDAIIHAAADTRFHPERREDQWRTNVSGALTVAGLTDLLEAPRLIHLSTLFVGGAHATPFTESDLLRGQRFRCNYEKSKCEAETRLRAWALDSGCQLDILRPGIVVGDSREGATLRFPHLYGFMRALWRFGRERRPGETVCLPFDPQTRLPLICVDHVSQFVAANLGVPRRPNGVTTRHLMAKTDVTLADLCDHLAAEGTVAGVRFDPSLRWEAAQAPRSGRALWAWSLAHRPYLSNPGVFSADRTWREFRLAGLGLPEITGSTLNRIRDHWSLRARAVESEAAA